MSVVIFCSLISSVNLSGDCCNLAFHLGVINWEKIHLQYTWSQSLSHHEMCAFHKTLSAFSFRNYNNQQQPKVFQKYSRANQK